MGWSDVRLTWNDMTFLKYTAFGVPLIRQQRFDDILSFKMYIYRYVIFFNSHPFVIYRPPVIKRDTFSGYQCTTRVHCSLFASISIHSLVDKLCLLSLASATYCACACFCFFLFFFVKIFADTLKGFCQVLMLA